MPSVLNILPNAVSQTDTQAFLATVAEPAPITPSDKLLVSVDWNTSTHLVVDSWTSIGPLTPQVGDQTLLLYDDQRYLRCVWWGPSQPVESTARAFAITAHTVGPGPSRIPLDGITFDTGQNVDLVNSKYVVPFRGVYDVSGQVAVVPVASAGTMQLYASIYVNDAERSRGERRDDVDPVGSQASVVVHDRVMCVAGDTIALWVYTSSATTLDGTAGSGAGGASGDNLTSLTNYLSITHASY